MNCFVHGLNGLKEQWTYRLMICRMCINYLNQHGNTKLQAKPSINSQNVCMLNYKKNHTVPWFPVDFPFNKSNEIDLFFWRVEISFLLQIASPVTSRFTHILMF
jgi:hypothetical protein